MAATGAAAPPAGARGAGAARACPVCPGCGGRRFERRPGAPALLRCRSCGRESPLPGPPRS